MKSIFKFLYLLNSSQKKQLVVLGFLLLISTFLEMLGLGILLPALGLILNPDISNDYPFLKTFLYSLNGLTHFQITSIGMLVLIIVYIIKAVFLMFTTSQQAKFSANLSAKLSKELFFGYLQQPYNFYLDRNTAHLVRNIQGEVDQFSAVSQSVINLSIEISTILGISSMLIMAEPVGATVIIIFLLSFGLLFHLITKNKILGWGKSRLYHDSRISQHLIQGLGSIKDVKLFGREIYFLNKFDRHNFKKALILSKQTTLLQVPRLYMEVLAVIGLAGLIIIMMFQNKPVGLFIPTIGIFVAAAFRMIPSVNRIMSSIQGIRYSGAVVDVLFNEFNLIRNTKSEFIENGIISFESTLDVENLSFSYNNDFFAVQNINLSIKKGQMIGIIGQSGSGKSTLVDLILGLLQPQEGFVRSDGILINNNLRNWHNHIGYVPQTIFLIDDSIRRNIAFGIPDDDIDDILVNRCVMAAQLDKYIESLPDGISTFVGERGIRLSGGQRQRIGIARALYNDPPVLILDEATSALDSATEKEVMLAVNALHGVKTIIIIAHRLTTISNCDWIYMLEKGKLIKEGVPNQVLH